MQIQTERKSKFNLVWAVTLSVALSFLSCKKKPTQTNQNTFSFNAPREFSSLDPLLIKGTNKDFVLFNLHRGLFYYNKNNVLTPHGIKSCEFKSPLVFTCTLKHKKWSDGSDIEAKHYIYTYHRIKSLQEESLEFLQNIKNIKNHGRYTLEFTLTRPYKNFKHHLANIVFSPRPTKKIGFSKLLFSGPYKVKSFDKAKLVLENNPFYDSLKRPDVTSYFIDEPTAALSLYESGTLTFLRYLETSRIPMYKSNLYSIPQLQLDGLILSSKIPIETRKLLATALDYMALKKIFYSSSDPGCVPLPKQFFKSSLPCIFFNKNLHKNLDEQYTLHIPSIASEDHLKFAQWAQESWKKNLGLNIEIQQHEIKSYYEKINSTEDFLIYRKSISQNEINCTNSIETLQEQKEFKLLKISTKDCDAYFNKLLKNYNWIPLGMPSFAHLHAKDYTGYYINMLGQFGLENLQRTSDDEHR